MSKSPSRTRQKATKKPAVHLTDEVADRIVDRIATSKDSLKSICAEQGMPTVTSVMRWLSVNTAFCERYARAKQIQIETLVDEMVEIADDGRNDMFLDDNGNEHVDNDVIQRSKLRIDTRKWLASKLLPKKYGDRVEIDAKVDSTVTHVLAEPKRMELIERRKEALKAASQN